jgi:Hint module
MWLSLILQIVLVGNLLNCSSCLEGVKELSLEETSTSNTRINLENAANAITGQLLAGYYSDILYTDATCDVIRYAKSYQLNVCTPSIDGNSFQVLANSTHTATYTYSDDSCAALSSTTIKPDALQICGKSFKTHSVTADHSSVTISSSAPLLSAAIFSTSSTVALSMVFIAVDGLCVNGMTASVAGSTATIKDHSSSGNGMLCTGSHNTITVRLNTSISSSLRGSKTFTTFSFIEGSSPFSISPYTSLVSTQEKKLLAVPSKSPNFFPSTPTKPTFPTYPTYPTYIYSTRVPTRSPSVAVPTSLPIKTTSYPTSLETLSGYYTRAVYSDSSCTAVHSSKSIKLNGCVYIGIGRYIIVTATPSFVTIVYYLDELCKTNPFSESTPYTTGACVDKVKIIISPTTAVASTNATSSMKFYPVEDSNCISAPYIGYTNALNTCINLTISSVIYSVSGNKLLRAMYDKNGCPGNSSLSFYEMGQCVSSPYDNAVYTTTAGSDATPASTTSSSSSSKEKSCFAGSETLSLESGEVKAISDVRVGDRVLAADAAGRTSYSDVVYVPHVANSDDALFTHITTASGRDIKMTPSHILSAGRCHSSAPLPLTYASSVSVGDCVMTVSGKDMVSTVATVQGKGLYTVVTKEEYIVVNGIIASPFAVNHMLANLYYNIHRFVYSTAPSILNYPALHSANEVLGSLIPTSWLSIGSSIPTFQ